jgi:hypothetical protein
MIESQGEDSPVTDHDLERMPWRKSSHSLANGDCVEIAELGHSVAVRNSRYPAGPVLQFPAERWREFIESIKNDELTS